jgi:NitT/TauT family transport system ATP-binding protein
MYIEVKNVTASYKNGGKNTVILDDVSLSVEKGEFISLIGPSGCGKTTLLNSIAGFSKITKGSITIDGQPVTKPKIEYITIFQNYGLLPWKKVLGNVEFGLEKKKVPREERERIARKYIGLVGLKGLENRYPHQLSGGQQQRVAIARALAVDPDILFMDEPFGALDAITRMKLQDDIRSICSEQKKTIIFVTHDIEEAVYLSDRVVIMTPNPGRIKTVVKLSLRKSRDRTADDFLLMRDKLFELFNMKHEEAQIEYII